MWFGLHLCQGKMSQPFAGNSVCGASASGFKMKGARRELGQSVSSSSRVVYDYQSISILIDGITARSRRRQGRASTSDEVESEAAPKPSTSLGIKPLSEQREVTQQRRGLSDAVFDSVFGLTTTVRPARKLAEHKECCSARVSEARQRRS